MLNRLKRHEGLEHTPSLPHSILVLIYDGLGLGGSSKSRGKNFHFC